MKKKRTYTMDRNSGLYERTVVGKDGQKHVDKIGKEGKDGHFTDEGQYRRAIERAVAENQR